MSALCLCPRKNDQPCNTRVDRASERCSCCCCCCCCCCWTSYCYTGLRTSRSQECCFLRLQQCGSIKAVISGPSGHPQIIRKSGPSPYIVGHRGVFRQDPSGRLTTLSLCRRRFCLGLEAPVVTLQLTGRTEPSRPVFTAISQSTPRCRHEDAGTWGRGLKNRWVLSDEDVSKQRQAQPRQAQKPQDRTP